MIQWDFPVDEPVPLSASRCRHLDEAVPTLAERIRTGTSIRALAGEHGVSREAIRRALRRAGLAVTVEQQPPPAMPLRRVRAHRLPGRGRSRTFLPDEVADFLARHHGGESIRALARATGVSHEAMRQTLARAAQAAAYKASA